MKKNRLALIIFSFSLVLCFSGVAMGGGIEPPDGGLPPGQDISDCLCIQSIVLPPGSVGDLEIPKLKGPYLKGTFTISYLPDPTNVVPSEWVVHIFLRWGNRIFIKPFYTLSGGANLITVSDEQLKNLLLQSQLFCYAQVESYFDLEGTPFVKELIITDRGGEDLPLYYLDDIVKGDIYVSVPPTYTCEDGSTP